MDCHQYYGRKKNRQDCYNKVIKRAPGMQFESKTTPNVIAKDEVLKQSELTPSPFPLPTGERIEVRGKTKNKERGFE